MDRVEDAHLVGNMIDVDHIRQVRVKALECALGHFGVESASADLLVGKVVEQRAGNRCFADTAFVCTDQYDRGLCHDALPIRWRYIAEQPVSRSSSRLVSRLKLPASPRRPALSSVRNLRPLTRSPRLPARAICPAWQDSEPLRS